MDIIASVLNAVADQAIKNEQLLNDCTKDSEGLYVCNICGKRKQFRFRNRLVPAQCQCDRDREDREFAEQKRQARIKRLYELGVTDPRYKLNTFERDERWNPQLSEKCQRYVEHWEEMRKNNCGAIFYGNVGAGKSFLACCIGNALVAEGVAVLITNLSKLVENRVQALKNGTQPINLKQFDLLIVDDLGIENATQTAYNIIDEWYRLGKPLIVTTNLTPYELKNATDIQHRRIFDRVVEMCGCMPIHVKGERRRYELSQQKKAFVDQILRGEDDD